MQDLISKEELEKLPPEEQKKWVDKTNKLLDGVRPLNREQRRKREKLNRRMRKEKRKQDGSS